MLQSIINGVNSVKDVVGEKLSDAAINFNLKTAIWDLNRCDRHLDKMMKETIIDEIDQQNAKEAADEAIDKMKTT